MAAKKKTNKTKAFYWSQKYRISADADLRGADLRGADLRSASLQGADLTGANLHGTSLDDVALASLKTK